MTYIIGNWKMNPVGSEKAKELFNSIDKSNEVIICPPSVYLPVLEELSTEIELGAQDCFWEENGAFTGEVSCSMVKEYCDFVIIGHSERREFDSEETISKKMRAAVDAKLTPILCVGETEEQRNQGKTEEIVRSQVKSALSEVGDIDSLVVGYEPRWAIGSGNPCSAQEAGPVALVIRNQLKKEGLGEVPVVYGGSVDSDNAASYLEFFDGWLIGGASLEPEEFNKIVDIA